MVLSNVISGFIGFGIGLIVGMFVMAIYIIITEDL